MQTSDRGLAVLPHQQELCRPDANLLCTQCPSALICTYMHGWVLPRIQSNMTCSPPALSLGHTVAELRMPVRLLGELLRLTDPIHTQYQALQSAWQDAEGCEVVSLELLDTVRSVLRPPGLAALNDLLGTRIAYALPSSLRHLRDELDSGEPDSQAGAASCASRQALC